MSTISETQMISALFEANKVLLARRPNVPLAIANGFLGAALWGLNKPEDEPRSIHSMAEMIGLPYTTVSRHFRYLGPWDREGLPGMKLVETLGGEDERTKCVRLSAEGSAVLREICSSVRRHLA